ncbi:energy-coupling factor transporter transmembrane component T family protein [Paucilactobacillus nenjiangensis]|uniref:energy-coupling factor transporter transmembrane component T family protein n=1 Tax=Paucilactobacillus nenjiangensis TaxID=1296540 RepID=UPI003FA2DEF0
MNPSFKLILIILISFEISFTRSLTANCVLIAVCLIYLMIHKIKLKTLGIVLLIPVIPAVALSITIAFFTPAQDYHFASVLFSRMFAYVLLGTSFTLINSPIELARSLEQNLHLPSKFAYGSLAAFGVLPKMKSTILTLQKAALMRGITLSYWSPKLYFKALLIAMNWSDELAQAMLSHGYVEDTTRTYAATIPIKSTDWAYMIVPILIIQPLLFLLP